MEKKNVRTLGIFLLAAMLIQTTAVAEELKFGIPRQIGSDMRDFYAGYQAALLYHEDSNELSAVWQSTDNKIRFRRMKNGNWSEETVTPYGGRFGITATYDNNGLLHFASEEYYGRETAPEISISESGPMGPLTINQSNPRYFDDGSGKAVYLVSAYQGKNLQDLVADGQLYEWDRYVNYLEEYNINLGKFVIRDRYFMSPTIYQRTGPGVATDGLPKFDLTKLNQGFFDRLRSRTIDLRDNGIYVVVMFFNVFDIKNASGGGLGWTASPYYYENNINGIDGDTNGDGEGLEAQDLPLPSGLEEIERARIRKIIDTVNDLDNVIYEVANENPSIEWQEWVANEIRTYEATKPRQHLVGLSSVVWGVSNADLLASDADWISPSGSYYRDNPPAADGSKILINDNDHTVWSSLSAVHVWKIFTRGMHPMSIEGWDGTFGMYRTDVHEAMKYTRSYAQRMDLVNMVPYDDLTSTTYCLANLGKEYLIYQPSPDTPFTVNLEAGTYDYEWFDTTLGTVAAAGRITIDNGDHPFTSPCSGEVALYLCLLSSDLNGDGMVNLADFNIMSHAWLDSVDAIEPDPCGLLGHWKFDETSGITAADSSGCGNTGNLMGDMGDPCWVSGYIDNALNFDGVDDYVSCGYDPCLDISDAITVAAWVKTDADNGARIATKHNNIPTTSYGWALMRRAGNDSIRWIISTTGTNAFEGYTSDNSCPVGRFCHVAATFDGSYMRVYINGVEDTDGDYPIEVSGSINVSTGETRIGSDSCQWGEYIPPKWDGLIDDVRIYNYALSNAQIRYLANLPLDSPANLNGDKEVNLDDFIILVNGWLENSDYL